MLLDQQERKRKEDDKSRNFINTMITVLIIQCCVVCVVMEERVLTVPSSAQIAKIDNEGFHQQKFKSAAGSSITKVHNLGQQVSIFSIMDSWGQ